MISFKDLNDTVYQLFAADNGLTLFSWFYNEENVKGVQIFTIFLQYFHDKQ